MSRRTRALLWIGAALFGVSLLAWPPIRDRPPAVPTFESLRTAHRPSDARLLDRHGEVLHELRIDPNARRLDWAPLADISPALTAAVIASEDRRFHRHGGVDARALLAAALQWIGGGRPRGASTLSMQMASLLSPGLRRTGGPRSLAQKWRQMRYAWALEARWSKDEILEAYLNRVTFRGELQGVAAAAQVLFGKAPHGITEAEAAVLTALIRAPNVGQAALVRRASSIRAAVGSRSGRDEIAAIVARVVDTPAESGSRHAFAPHLARRLLAPGQAPPGFVAALQTTLDGALQRAATEILRRQILASRAGHVRDGALLVADNLRGEVLAYVGSSGDLSNARHVDGVRARRQAGSTLKPFLYGLALERRLLTPASLLTDAPLELPQADGLYRPQNYDDRFKGLMTVRTALAGSVNVPAVKTLTLVGVETFAQHLTRLGLEGLTEFGDFYGPSLALGGSDVSLWELVNAYRSLANGGTWGPLRMATDSREPTALRRVYSEQTAFLLSSILSDRESRSVTFGLENPLATRFWTAVKTGTSKDMRDNWCIGFSRRYTVGVWVGNFSGEPMRDVSGVTGAAPIWLEVMAWLHRQSPSTPPAPPAGIVAKTVRFAKDVEPPRTEWFLAGTEPAETAPSLTPIHARILAPTGGTIIALDPDIPSSRQRMLFEAEPAGASARWALNGEDLGDATRLVTWRPEAGVHALSLVDGDRQILDTVTFEVRGRHENGKHSAH